MPVTHEDPLHMGAKQSNDIFELPGNIMSAHTKSEKFVVRTSVLIL
jgi:molybdopterin biosynthesis enzyme